MPNIKPVSDLRNYTEVLRDIAVGEPVFLTKNGRGRYVILDIEEYERTEAALKLMGELAKGESSAQEKGWTDLAEVEKMLGVANG
ncbi:Phd_YefM [uncultured Roseburia sp.]|uniref:Antitoxin n=1 Tax=Brotonthovivens ammoniilytica TaxID=2981725 RepID=A0ABT2TIP0_9FIRM|nr:type II toxin-antitoxin system prevent-host-death family antitoxin [Brotonthovivens ammoniilytica]MCU6762045.1 type II toxin-antitoxin system prevent-host-death family antitoxin [Brotonthovivens ammoniilytica]SCI53937.1 Phd_YefM [uncultured Roseburia sp.]